MGTGMFEAYEVHGIGGYFTRPRYSAIRRSALSRRQSVDASSRSSRSISEAEFLIAFASMADSSSQNSRVSETSLSSRSFSRTILQRVSPLLLSSGCTFAGIFERPDSRAQRETQSLGPKVCSAAVVEFPRSSTRISVAESGIGDDVMPLRHRNLTCDQQ